MQDICVAARAPFLNNPEIHAEVVGHLDRGEHYPDRAMYEAILPEGFTLDDVIAAPGGIDVPAPLDGAFFERHVKTPDHRIRLAPGDLMAELPGVLASPPQTDEDYPLVLVSGFRRLRSFNSWTHNMPSLTDRLDEPAAHVHPSTAQSYKISEGQVIDVTTARGTLTMPARLDQGIREGVVAIPQFWGHHYDSGQSRARRRPGVNVNRLHTSDDRDTFTGMPIFNGRPCAIAPTSNHQHREPPR
jgi:anaerobic selenocysteine-containing dehydrogenase